MTTGGISRETAAALRNRIALSHAGPAVDEGSVSRSPRRWPVMRRVAVGVLGNLGERLPPVGQLAAA